MRPKRIFWCIKANFYFIKAFKKNVLVFEVKRQGVLMRTPWCFGSGSLHWRTAYGNGIPTLSFSKGMKFCRSEDGFDKSTERGCAKMKNHYHNTVSFWTKWRIWIHREMYTDPSRCSGWHFGKKTLFWYILFHFPTAIKQIIRELFVILQPIVW